MDDIVDGTLLAAEKIDDDTAVNLGTMKRVQVIDAVHEVLRYTGHKAEIEFRPDMPTGPLDRVADNSLARELLAWEPKVTFIEGSFLVEKYQSIVRCKGRLSGTHADRQVGQALGRRLPIVRVHQPHHVVELRGRYFENFAAFIRLHSMDHSRVYPQLATQHKARAASTLMICSPKARVFQPSILARNCR